MKLLTLCPGLLSHPRGLKWAPVIVLVLASAACNLPAQVPFFGPSPTPTLTSTPTLTPTPTSTPTPTPSPTPVPEKRIQSGDRAAFIGEYERAAGDYQIALEASSDGETRAGALLGLGRSQAAAGDPLSAVETFNRLLAEHPGSSQEPYAYFALAQAYITLERYSEAADAFLGYLTLRPGIVDAYVLELRGDALLQAGEPAAAVIDYRAALNAPSTLNPLLLEIKAGRAFMSSGDYNSAVSMFADVYNRAVTDFTRSQMAVLMGQAYAALGQTEQAQAAYMDAVINFPTTYDAYTALLTLVEAGVPVNELNRGIVDYYAGQYGVALAALDRYLQASPPDPAAARYFNGLTLRSLGTYEEALNEFDKVIQNYPLDRYAEKAYEQKAFTQWSYLDRHAEAIETLLAFVSANPQHARAAEFLYDAASVAELSGELAQAAALWERLANEYPASDQVFRAMLLAGVCHYRLENYAGAQALFQRLGGISVGLEQRAAAFLWQGKSQAALGDQVAARASWEQAALADPTGYYSERGRDLLLGRLPFASVQTVDFTIDSTSERQEAEAWMAQTFALPAETDFSAPGPLAAEPGLVRGTELWKLGMLEDARSEFDGLRQALQQDPAGSYRLANYLVELGFYRQAIQSARQVLTVAGMADADTMNAPAYFNHLRFGTYFSELVLPQAQAHGFDPLFLFSLIRQESAFEGFVRSDAGARGLMQIVPATGEEIANRLNWPPGYTEDDLYRPNVSIVLGSDYLATWRDRLDGNIFAALAAYNGGPGNAAAWLELAPDDPDVYLEVVRFEETRRYIRGVYENFAIYRRIYNRTP